MNEFSQATPWQMFWMLSGFWILLLLNIGFALIELFGIVHFPDEDGD